MNQTIILVHGYGVRGSFWEKLAPLLRAKGYPVTAPDLDGESPTDLADQLEALARAHATERPVVLVGHSLGGIIATWVVARADPSVVSHAVAIASPLEGSAQKMSPVMRFLIRYRLLPPALVRPRFFSRATRPEDQKKWFSRAVAESPALQSILFSTDWFPMRVFAHKPPQRCLAILSEADRIVDAAATRRLAAALGADEFIFGADRGIGHNDFAASDTIAAEVSQAIIAFLAG